MQRKHDKQLFKKSRWFESEQLETTKKREERAAKQFDAKIQPASGATPWAKEDFKSDMFLYQHKSAKGATHTMKKMDLVDLKRNAVDEGLNPAYIIDFDGEVWVAVPQTHFDIMREDFDVI